MSRPPRHEYQNRAMQFCAEKRRAYLAIDMGLGKTRITLDLLAACQKKALVIAPLRGVYSTWPEECEKWTPHLTYQILHGPAKESALNKEADLYFMNPEGIKWLYKALVQYYKIHKSVPFTELIIDEGSMWKSASTKRFETLKYMLPIFQDLRIVLSGTPAPNSLMDLWSQYYILDEGKSLFDSYYRFRATYFYQIDHNGYYWGLNQGSRETIHKSIAPRTFRLDAKDYLDMPDYIPRIINLELKKKTLLQYKKLEKDFFLEMEGTNLEAFNAAALSNKLRQFIQGGMYTDAPGETSGRRPWMPIHDLKIEALKEVLESGQSILCAIQFKFELEMIRKAFPKMTIPVIAGGAKPKDVARYIREWNSGETHLLLCHPASLSHSVNIQTGGHIIVWFGLPWSLEQYQQLTGRLYRQGQKHAVVAHHFLIKNTVDEAVYKALTRKDDTQKRLLDYLNEYKESIC